MLRPTPNKTFIDALIKSDLISEEDVIHSVSEIQLNNENLSSNLVRKGLLTSRQMMDLISSQLDMEAVDLKDETIDPSAVEKVPVKFASYYQFMPIRHEDDELLIAVSEPMDLQTQDDIRVHLGLKPKTFLASIEDINESLKKYYGLGSQTIGELLDKESDKHQSLVEGEEIEDIDQNLDDPSVANLVNQIIFEAFQKRATDIHIEPYRDKLRLRYRIDGVLVDANLSSDAKIVLPSILSRIKIMANLSITERRLPQDGSAVVKTRDQNLDLRVSTIPTLRGESMVIRILPSSTTLLNLEKLGFNDDNAKRFRNLISSPHGIIFVTGPTGSGKTTTLYACLNEINTPGHKIITIEDPVEYEMEGITQIQVNEGIGFDFARGLRSVLRHDPDVLMVGEVRDLETAEIAIRTALTGHLVFSTLHTNDAASGVTRLIDMGVEPYLVASSVQAFVAQRLVRVICPECKTQQKDIPQDIREEIVSSLGLPSDEPLTIYHGKGCDHCNGTGYYGRSAIYEILELTDDLKGAVLDKPRAEYIKQRALHNGMRTLRQDGWLSVLKGVTTPEEIMHVTVREEIQPAANQ